MTVRIRHCNRRDKVFITYRDREGKVCNTSKTIPLAASTEERQTVIGEMQAKFEKIQDEERLSYVRRFWNSKGRPKYFSIERPARGDGGLMIRAVVGRLNITKTVGVKTSFEEAFDAVWYWVLSQTRTRNSIHRDVMQSIVRAHVKQQYVEAVNERLFFSKGNTA